MSWSHLWPLFFFSWVLGIGSQVLSEGIPLMASSPVVPSYVHQENLWDVKHMGSRLRYKLSSWNISQATFPARLSCIASFSAPPVSQIERWEKTVFTTKPGLFLLQKKKTGKTSKSERKKYLKICETLLLTDSATQIATLVPATTEEKKKKVNWSARTQSSKSFKLWRGETRERNEDKARESAGEGNKCSTL